MFRSLYRNGSTSGLIPGIGSQFDGPAFAKAFKDAHVDGVNLFAKCHHGHSYHPTKVGAPHPHLEIDLLGQQIEALQAVGITTLIRRSASRRAPTSRSTKAQRAFSWKASSRSTCSTWRAISPAMPQLALGQDKMIRASLPTAGRATVRRQRQENRDIVHLLYATPILRGNLRNRNVEPIQDLVTLSDIDVAVAVDNDVASVRLAPEGGTIAFEQTDGVVTFTVPKLRGHQMVEIAYAAPAGQ